MSHLATPKSAKTKEQLIKARVSPAAVHSFVHDLVGEDMHAKRVLSLANGVVGVLNSAALAIHLIGHGYAEACGTNTKHGIKQVDRLLSNSGITLAIWFSKWVTYVVGDRKEIQVALDWTEFDPDGHSTIALYLLTRHGRATPLLWKTVRKKTLKHRQGSYEDEVIELLHTILPPDVQVTLLADRGFGDQKRYAHLEVLGWSYVIRFRENILVEDATGCRKTAGEWVPSNGRAKRLEQVKVTADRAEVPAVVCVKKKMMKDAWCLATNRTDLDSTSIVKLYGRRFTIEETFRDQKDIHFGFGLSSTHISEPMRRDRLLMLAAMAQALLTLLGAAGEAVGLDRMLKANTVKRRTLSLLRQGTCWFRALPNMPDDRARILLGSFDKILAEHAFSRDALGAI